MPDFLVHATVPLRLRLASLGLGRVGVVLVAVLVMAVWGAVPAHAHTVLVESTPAEGGEIEPPADVVLVFNEELIQLGSEMTVTDAAGTVSVLETLFPDAHILSGALPALAPGVATVNWRVVSADGHPVEGVLSFTVLASEPIATAEPTSSATPTATMEATPSVMPDATDTVTTSVPPMDEDGSATFGWGSGNGGLWWWVGALVVVAAAIVVGVVLVRRRRE